MAVTYNEIFDSEIDPESPVTESLATRWRDNPIAMIQGASGAPRATSKIITPGGSDADGALVDGTSLGSAPGFFEYSSATLTLDKTFPWITLMRVNGDVSMVGTSKTITLQRPAVGTDEPRDAAIVSFLRGLSGTQGTIGTSGNQGSGGGGGAGGTGGRGGGSVASPGLEAVLASGWAGMNRPWLQRKPLVGGPGGINTAHAAGGNPGGGCLILLVNGDCDFTGFTINVSGGSGIGSGGNGVGGGGGGSIFIFCNGNIHDGTFLALGGNGVNGTSGSGDSGGGGGGMIYLIAASFTGSQTRTVTGGTALGGGGGSVAGTNGVEANITLSEEIINSMLLGISS